MRLTKEQIEKINEECVYDQGIFVEPNGIPTRIKEPVIYGRYETGGYSGGNYHGDDPRPYFGNVPNNRMQVLDIVLTELCPDISYLQYKKIEKLIDSNEYSIDEYYGNYTDWKIEFIELSKLYDILGI